MRWLILGAGLLPLAAGGVPADPPPAGSSPPHGYDYAQARLGRPGQGAGLLASRFPGDVYAQPAFNIVYDKANPVRRRAAVALLEGPSAHHTLFRSGPAQAHLCHIPPPRAVPPWEQPHSTAAFLRQHLPADHANDTAAIERALEAERQRIIVHGLELLEPMKQYCIYQKQPADWFTYSFCHGRAVRQFHAKPETSAALISAVQQHMETARASGAEAKGDYRLVGGIPGPDGQGTTYKFAVSTPQGEESFVSVTPQEPLEDTLSDSFCLGNWHKGVERVAGTDLHFTQLSNSAAAQPVIDVSDTLSQGTELIEVVRLGTGDEQRYLSQLWVDGTRCNLNDERRMVEIQYHCAEEGSERIALIKEVTTCNYVVVIETPRLCAEPAFLTVKQDAENLVTCREIVSDDWTPPPSAPPQETQGPAPSLAPPEAERGPGSTASDPSLDIDHGSARDQGDQLVSALPQETGALEAEAGPSVLGQNHAAPPLEPAVEARPEEQGGTEDIHISAPNLASGDDRAPSEENDASGGGLPHDTGPDARGVAGDEDLSPEAKDGGELVLTFLGLNEDGFEKEEDFVVTADELEALGMGHLLALTEDGHNAEVEIGWDLFEYLQERERLNTEAASDVSVAATEAHETQQDQPVAQSAAQPVAQPVAQAGAWGQPGAHPQLMATLVDAINQYLQEVDGALENGRDGAQVPVLRDDAERDTVRDWVRRYKESVEQQKRVQHVDRPARDDTNPQGTGGAGAGAGDNAGGNRGPSKPSTPNTPKKHEKPLAPRKVQPSLYDRISLFYNEKAPAAPPSGSTPSVSAPPEPDAASPRGGVAPAKSEWDHTVAEGDTTSR